MNLPSILILIGVAVWFVLAVRYIRKQKGGCSCCGSEQREKSCGKKCSGCSSCVGCASCGCRRKEDKGKT